MGKSVLAMWRTNPKFYESFPKQSFVGRVVIIASCVCEFHPMCIATLMVKYKHSCPCCEDKFIGAWIAQFGEGCFQNGEGCFQNENKVGGRSCYKLR